MLKTGHNIIYRFFNFKFDRNENTSPVLVANTIATASPNMSFNGNPNPTLAKPSITR